MISTSYGQDKRKLMPISDIKTLLIFYNSIVKKHNE